MPHGRSGVDMRLYGGWYEDTSPTRDAQHLERELPGPTLIPIDGDGGPLMVNVELAYSMRCDPGHHIAYTLRSKTAPRWLEFTDPTVFERCQFEQLDLSEVKQIERSRLLECEVFAVVRSKEGSAIFDPMVIVRALRQAGFDVSMPPSDVADEAAEMVEPEVRLVLTERMCRAFFRSTGVNENTFRQRMGKDWTVFSRQVLPALQTCSVIVKADYKGSGSQQRYRLGVSLLAVQQSIERANGSFDTFVESFRG